MYKLSVKSHFDAAHYIKDYPGKCAREHGHRWEVEAVFEGKELDSLNILFDFGGIKRCLNIILEKLDHYQLNEVLDEPHVTAEYLSKWIFDHWISGPWPSSIGVWESPGCCVTYSENGVGRIRP